MNEHQGHRGGCTELRELLQDGREHLQPQHQPFCVKAAEAAVPPTGQGLPWPALPGGAKRSAAGEGASAFPRRQAKRAAPAKARRRQGLKPVRGETPQAARCAARKPGPKGRRPEEFNDQELERLSSPAVSRAGCCMPVRAWPAPQGGAKRSAAGDGEAVPPEASAARRRQGIEARRDETPPAARCNARKPGPPGRRPGNPPDQTCLPAHP